MPVEGEVDDAENRLRTQLADGTIDGVEYSVALNIDSRAVYVEFPELDTRIRYRLADLVRDAYGEHIDVEGE